MPNSYSINALAEELKTDRRTLKKRLENVAPAGIGQRNAPTYLMSDVVAVLIEDAVISERNRLEKLIPSGGDGENSIAKQSAEAKLRKDLAEAEMAEIKVQKELEILVDADLMNRLFARVILNCRQKLLSFPSSVATLDTSQGTKEIVRAAQDLVEDALTELADLNVDDEGDSDDGSDGWEGEIPAGDAEDSHREDGGGA